MVKPELLVITEKINEMQEQIDKLNKKVEDLESRHAYSYL